MNTNIIVAVVVIVIVVGLYLLFSFVKGHQAGSIPAADTIQAAPVDLGSVKPQPESKQPSAPAAGDVKQPSASQSQSQPKPQTEMLNGIKTEILQPGTGVGAKTGDTVTVHYVGTLTNGQKFDASRDHGQPFSFPLGAGQVIKGWDQGVVGMKVGEQRRLTIPPALGYGAGGAGPIPPNSTLIFEIELLKIN